MSKLTDEQVRRVLEKNFNDPLRWLDEAIYKAPKWKNLAFTKDGRSYLGRLTYPSRDSALKGHVQCYKKMQAAVKEGRGARLVSESGHSILFPEEYSH